MRGKRLSRDAALRIGAIGLAVVAAALVLPGLLSPPEPPPLPADVGLGATGATGAAGIVAEADPGRDEPRGREGKPERREAAMPEPEASPRGGAGARARSEAPGIAASPSGAARRSAAASTTAGATRPRRLAPPTYAAPAPAPAPLPLRRPAAPGEFGP